MTKKDYIRIAAALNGAFPILENTTPVSAWRLAVDAIADMLAQENPRFDRQRFMQAVVGGAS